MRINYGCGRQVWDGFFNIDAVRHPKAPREPELIHVCRFDGDGKLVHPTPLADGCADELHAIHVLEHVYRWEAHALLAEWRRLLKLGGLLVLELPNLEAACKNVLAGQTDQMGMWPLYGDPSWKDPYMTHRWAYSPKTLRPIVEGVGFVDVKFRKPQWHGGRDNRDMRMEARRA